MRARLRKRIDMVGNTKLNALALHANFFILAAIGLVVNPLMVRSLGAQDFGTWKACLKILDLSSVADGRATQALKWIVAHRSEQADDDRKRRDVGAALAIWLLWMPLLIGALAIVIIALPRLINGISDAELPTVRLAAGFLGLNLVLTALLGLPDAVLVGTNQGYRTAVVATTFLVLSNLAMLITAYQGAGLVGLGLVALTSSLLTGLTNLTIARRRVPWWGIGRPNWDDVRGMLGFSNWTLGWSLVQTLLLSSEVLLIGYLSGPVDVSRYTFTSYIAQFTISVCLIPGSAVAPRLGALIGAGDTAGAARLYGQAREILLAVVVICGSAIVVSNRLFVELWAGPSFYIGDMTNLAIVVALFQLAVIRFEAQVQDVGLKIGRKVLWGSAGVLTSFVLAAVAYRLTGNIAAMILGQILGRLPLNFIFPMQVQALMPERTNNFRALLAAICIILFVSGLSLVWQGHGWGGLVISIVASTGITSGGAFFLIFSKSIRTSITGMLINLRWRAM